MLTKSDVSLWQLNVFSIFFSFMSASTIHLKNIIINVKETRSIVE